MPNSADILWFKSQFQQRIEAATAGTPLSVDFLAALACQETGEVWPLLRRKNLPVDHVLALCVGDTLDSDKGRSAFPRTQADLTAAPRGQEMFDIARKCLVDMAAHVPAYAAAAKRPNKFCHGFGLFQRDLQFFLDDPDYFLERRFESFEATLDHCLKELRRAVKKLGFESRTALSDHELAAVGIAYNTGGFKPNKGLQQGHFNGTQFYGEALLDFIRMAHTVAHPGGTALLPQPIPGQATVAQPAPIMASGPVMRVDTREGMLRLRREPHISEPPQANVIAHLPDGHAVRTLSGKKIGGFIEVETSLSGALLRGFASAKFLEADEDASGVLEGRPAVTPPARGIIAVSMPRKPSTITRRSGLANAHSLNEKGQPGRSGKTAEELRAELAAIGDWLAVDDAEHLRYQPRGGLTFCNIYAHDYCHLAGVFLPRVWWSSPALLKLADGEEVTPLIGDTIFEVRANDLFRWLRDFGPQFGWRRTGTLTKLQNEVNQGALGVIVARRKEDGRSGHIAMVVPETVEQQARRSAAGEISVPLQSQAGARNFRYGHGKANWWNGEEFAESAFWIHA